MLSSYVAIGVRLVAILFFFKAVREFVGVFRFFYEGNPYGDDTSVWPILVVALTSWALVFILWFSARADPGSERIRGQVLRRALDRNIQDLTPMLLASS